jgi:large subunit ribosomal protein L11
MSKEKIEVLVEAGKATAAPPLGPALGPLGVNIPKVVEEINKKTKDLAGMKVPVKVIVDKLSKNFDVEVGSPPAAALIKKELGLAKGSSEAGKLRVGDLTHEQVRKIAKAKFGSDDKSYINQVTGSARSMGITVGKGKVTKEELEAEKKEKEKLKEAAEKKGEEAKAKTEGEEVAKEVKEEIKEEKAKEKKEK